MPHPGEPAPPSPSTAPQPRPPSTPWLSYALIAGAGVMLVLDQLIPGRVVAPGVVLRPGALYGPSVRDGEWWRVFASILEHGSGRPELGTFLHLFFNLSIVWQLGRVLEKAMGTWRLSVLSAISALGGATASLAFDFRVITVGASGMLCGWIGALLFVATPAARRAVMVTVAQIAFISLVPGVSWASHLGGFLYGLPCGWALRGGAQRYRYVTPVLLFLAGVGALVAGTGHLQLR